MIVDYAVYVDGRRSEPCPLGETYRVRRERGGLAWVTLFEPTAVEFGSVAGEFGLRAMAAEDGIRAQGRPRLERHGNSVFVALKPARYREGSAAVEFGEVRVFLGPDFAVVIGRGEASRLDGLHGQLEAKPDLLRRGPGAALFAVVERVVRGYGPVVDALENDVDEVEEEVFGGNAGVSRRIYGLSREVIDLQRATRPLIGALDRLLEGEIFEVDREVGKSLRDVRDRVSRVVEQTEALRQLLSDIVGVNLTLVSVDQNDQTKRISAWAAILVVPTIITGVYGMNFVFMPELNWVFGYPFALVLMAATSALLYLRFKRSGWL